MPTFSAKKTAVSFRSLNGERSCRQYVWNQDQTYDGEFFRESLHADGTYKWKDSAVYEGGFYSNYKEGYAVMSFPDNSCFEGLFVRNQRFGPGIFTHSNGRQDVGFWMGRKLVRLSRSVDYIVPRLAPTSAAKVKLLQFQRLIPINEQSDESASEILNTCSYIPNYLSCPYSRVISDPRSYFFDKYAFEKTYFSNIKDEPKEILSDTDSRVIFQQRDDAEEETLSEFPVIPSHCLCPDSEFKMKYLSLDSKDVCEKKESTSNVEMGILGYFTHYGALGGVKTGQEKGLEDGVKTVEEEELIKRSKLLAWNRTELCVRMLREIFRYRAFEGKLTFNIAKLMLGARTEFRRTGENEKQCLDFLKACAVGTDCTVKKMICDYEISEELTDARGNNSVMFAAAADQQEVIDVLADYGADVNSFNDESLTPLNLCLLRRLSQVFGLGNWETAFLPKEIDKNSGILDDEYEVEEWRKRVSIQSLDRIFGDGASIYGNKKSSLYIEENESWQPKTISSTRGTYSSLTGLPVLNQSSFEMNGTPLSWKAKLLGFPTNLKKTHMPKMEEFDKSVNSSDLNEYFFELAPQHKQNFKAKESKGKLKRVGDEKIGEEMPSVEDVLSGDVIKRIQEIDKTIEKLLNRGADPNISEVPKPSIHLGVFTKNVKIVNLLLSYGANPNCKLYPNEGLLTPLHVVVLLKPHHVYVDICKVLLKFGANPEEETLPEFAYYPEEKQFLNLDEGRTPLQLLCMRPDLQDGDPELYSTKMALLLAKVSNRNRLYNGFTYPALAMFFGNVKLMKELFNSKLFDPNAILGNNRGTILHVLVSTDFQKRTSLVTSIGIYDYLLSVGANPLKRFHYPLHLAGNCVDYGHREVKEEKASRMTSKETGKNSRRKSKVERDHLEDHIKLLEYMSKKIEREKSKRKGRRHRTSDELEEEEEGETEGTGEESEGGSIGKGGRGRRGRIGKKGERGGKGGREGREERVSSSLKGKKEVEFLKKEKEGKGFHGDGKKRRSKMELDDEGNIIKKKKSENQRLKEKGLASKGRDNADNGAYGEDGEHDKANRYGRSGRGKEKKKKGATDANKSTHTLKDRKDESGHDVDQDDDGTVKRKKLAKKGTGTDSGQTSKDKKSKKQELADSKKRDANLKAKNLLALAHPTLLKSKAFNKFFGGKYLCCAETFPEKLRQLILKLIGNCSGLDIDELLLPYVVLRDGDLYYGFKGKGARSKGQYSLV